MRLSLFAAAAVAGGLLAGSAQAAVNLVTNGDFSAGNTGFGSEYTHVAGPNSAFPESTYAVDTSPQNVHDYWADFGDHTSDSGNMMIVNGAQQPGRKVWFEDGIAVAENTTYFFSTWIRSSYNTAPAQLDFSINGSAIGPTFQAGQIADGWQLFFASWNSGGYSLANIALVNQNLAYSGNDFALDDISLSTRSPTGAVPEPATWAMMILGFGAAGAMLRRRQGVAAAA